VTALYEVIPVGAKGRVDALRYGAPEAIGGKSDELAMLKLRYKLPNATASTLMEYPISTKSKLNADKVSTDFQLSASVAAFGQLLRGGKYIGSFTYGDVAKLAKPALDYDSDGYRREFVSLVKLAESLTPKQPERVSKAD
jgi:Ca-activated chloride channel family protein